MFTFVTGFFCSTSCFLKFIYAVMSIFSLSFLLLSNIPIHKYSTNCLSILSLIIPFFATMVSIMNIHIKFLMWTNIFISLGWIPGRGIASLWGRFMFNFTRNSQTVLQSIFTNLHSHQQCMRVCCSTSSPTFAIVSLFYFVHSNEEYEPVVIIAFQWTRYKDSHTRSLVHQENFLSKTCLCCLIPPSLLNSEEYGVPLPNLVSKKQKSRNTVLSQNLQGICLDSGLLQFHMGGEVAHVHIEHEDWRGRRTRSSLSARSGTSVSSSSSGI